MNENPLSFRRHHIGRALARAYWLFEDQFLSGIRAQGYDDIRRSDVNVIRFLPLDGARTTDLAERAKISKQGMAKLVSGLENRKYVSRGADPEDGRAQLVVLTEKGIRFLEDAGVLIETLEAEWSDLLGLEELDDVKKALLHVADVFGSEDYL
ncbi:MAG: winged helix-turn-helix transcriptional regulator [Deltaproteobacteria bacterium]|nr:winged helix-turn-helix transcriptional regulator [Deltaproteobacteria bacterium]